MTRAEDIHNRRWAILGVLCLSLFVIVMDNTIVNVALPSLVRELGATTSQLQWIVDSYTLVFAGLLLSFGALGDRFGRKGALTRRHGDLRCVVSRGGAVDECRPAHRRSGLDGCRRRADHAGDAVDPDERVHGREGASGCDRPVVRDRRRGRRPRPGHGRFPARPLLVGFGVHGQRADRDRRSHRRLADRADLS